MVKPTIKFDVAVQKNLDAIMAKESIYRGNRKDKISTKLSDDWTWTSEGADCKSIRIEVIRSGANEAVLNTQAEIATDNTITFDDSVLSNYEQNIKDGDGSTDPAVYIDGNVNSGDGVRVDNHPAWGDGDTKATKDTNYTPVGGIQTETSLAIGSQADTVRVHGNAPFTRAKDTIVTNSYEATLGETLMTNIVLPEDYEASSKVKGKLAKFLAITERTKAKRYDKYVNGKAIIGGNLNFDPTNTTAGKYFGLDAIDLKNSATTPDTAKDIFFKCLSSILDTDLEGRDVSDYEFYCTHTFANLLREKLRLITSDSAYGNVENRPDLTFEGVKITPIASERLRGLAIDNLRVVNRFEQRVSGAFLNEHGRRRKEVTPAVIQTLINSKALVPGSTTGLLADGRRNPEAGKFYIPIAGIFLNKNAHVAPYKFSKLYTDKSHSQGPNDFLNETYLYDAFTKPLREDWTIPILDGATVTP